MSQLIWDAFFIGNPTNFTLLYIVTTLTMFTLELLLQIQSYFHGNYCYEFNNIYSLYLYYVLCRDPLVPSVSPS